jgi:hypothetical protein
MINTLVELREKGFKTATITNNWRYEHPKNRHFNDNSYDLFRQKGEKFALLTSIAMKKTKMTKLKLE